jgi:phosphate transport system permease protein
MLQRIRTLMAGRLDGDVPTDVRRRVALAVFGEDVDPAARPVIGSLALSIIATALSFIFAPGVVVFPLVASAALVVYGWTRHQAPTARLLTLVATASTVLTLGLITVYLVLRAVPAMVNFGLGLVALPKGQWFFWLDAVLPTTETLWNPRGGAVSLIPMVWASVVVTLIAGMVAAPLGVLGALFISHVASDRTRSLVKPGVEVLAGIPSIVYGFIGFKILNGFVRTKFLDEGASFLIAGTVVGVMALPTVVSVSEDALSSVPKAMDDGALAMGATRWQTMKSISVPAASSGISAAIILGLGRAIGETMAVAAIMAAGVGMPKPLYDLFDASATLTSLIATQYGSASEATIEVLFVAGVMLFGVVATMSIVSQRIERRMERRLQGER